MYKEDYGKYTCKAGNRYGTQAQEMELYESTMPICPPLCGDTNLNSANVHYFNIFLLFISPNVQIVIIPGRVQINNVFSF